MSRVRHYATQAVRWVRGLFGAFPFGDVPQPEIPPPPVKNVTDPEDDPALNEMGESLARLSWRRELLRRERDVLRRSNE